MKHRVLFFFSILLGTTAIAQEKLSVEQIASLALQKNYDVLISKNTAVAAETDYNYSNGAFLPTVNANGSRLWNSNSVKQIAADNTIKEKAGVASNNLNGTVQLTWTLFDGTKMFATRQRLAEIAVQGELNVKAQMLNSLASVINSYYNIVQQKQQLKATREQMSVSEERVKLAQKKLDVGTGSKPELLQAKVDLNSQRTLFLQQETIIAQLKDQLNGLVGLQLPEVYDVADTIIINLNITKDEITNDIEQKSFALQTYKSNISIAKYALHERRAERYPVINFVSAYTYSRLENTVSFNPGNPLYNRSYGYNYGATISIPFINGFNNRRLVSQAKLNIDRQELLYQQQKTAIDVGIKNAFVNYENTKKILLIQEENILVARENVYIALETFKRGVITFIELRTAQQSLADAYYQLITARYNAKVAETELLRLNGGLLR